MAHKSRWDDCKRCGCPIRRHARLKGQADRWGAVKRGKCSTTIIYSGVTSPCSCTGYTDTNPNIGKSRYLYN